MNPLSWSIVSVLLGGALLVWSSRGRAYRTERITEVLLEDHDRKQHITDKSSLTSNNSTKHWWRGGAWVVGGVIASVVQGLVCGFSISGMLLFCGIGGLVGELFITQQRARAQRLRLRQLEFYLPAAMERILLGVSSGLDIVPALREASRRSQDPVSELLQQIVVLSEGGMPVERAFEVASQQVQSTAVKHACIHLALAHSRGGEVVRPLKELSDAAMIAYQETIEERIARLPVQAVLPLVITLAGLIVCFLTIPLIQVSSITKRVLHADREQR